MKFAILLLAVLTLACVFGSVIPQGGTLDEYLGAYGERGGALIVGLCLDDVLEVSNEFQDIGYYKDEKGYTRFGIIPKQNNNRKVQARWDLYDGRNVNSNPYYR